MPVAFHQAIKSDQFKPNPASIRGRLILGRAMVEKSRFTFEGKKYEVRAMDIPAGIVAKAFRDDGQPSSAPYIIPREVIGDILAAKLSPSPAALMLRLMAIVQGDIESDMGKELAKASTALNKA